MRVIEQDVKQHARKIAGMQTDDRHRYLQVLIGTPTDSPGELHFRALLLTTLNEMKLWPPRGFDR